MAAKDEPIEASPLDKRAAHSKIKKPDPAPSSEYTKAVPKVGHMIPFSLRAGLVFLALAAPRLVPVFRRIEPAQCAKLPLISLPGISDRSSEIILIDVKLVIVPGLIFL